uniref:PGG domain-containing protein n=1 Tax=Vitis vinifera TaxID=29760 RepID=F6HHI2_VITVI
MVRELLMLHREVINNVTNSVTVVVVTYAIVAFAVISTVLGGDNDLGVSAVVDNPSFEISFVFNAIALFMSSAADVVWITLMRGETESERRVKEVINKLM